MLVGGVPTSPFLEDQVKISFLSFGDSMLRILQKARNPFESVLSFSMNVTDMIYLMIIHKL